MKGRSAGEKAFTRRTPIEGAPRGARKGTYGALGSCLGSGRVVGAEGDSESVGLARGLGAALVRRAGVLGSSGSAVEVWRA
jgi:hypothetical protein